MGIQVTGGTALWEALVACEGHLTRYTAQYPNARKRIVVLSDGQDTTDPLPEMLRLYSSRHSRARTTRYAFRASPPSNGDDSEDDLYSSRYPLPSSSKENYSQHSQGNFNTLPSPKFSTQNFSTPDAVSGLNPFSIPVSRSTANLGITLPGGYPIEPGDRYNSSSSGLSSYIDPMSPFGSITNSSKQNSSSQLPPLYRPWTSTTSNNLNLFIASTCPTTAPDTTHTGNSIHTFVLPALSSSRITAQETCLRLQRNNIIVDSFFIGNGTNQDLKRISFA